MPRVELVTPEQLSYHIDTRDRTLLALWLDEVIKRHLAETRWGPFRVTLFPMIEAIGPAGEAIGADWLGDSRVICRRHEIEARNGVEAIAAIDALRDRLAAELAELGPG